MSNAAANLKVYDCFDRLVGLLLIHSSKSPRRLCLAGSGTSQKLWEYKNRQQGGRCRLATYVADTANAIFKTLIL